MTWCGHPGADTNWAKMVKDSDDDVGDDDDDAVFMQSAGADTLKTLDADTMN